MAARAAALMLAISTASQAAWITLPNSNGSDVSLDATGPAEIAPGLRQVWVLENHLAQENDDSPRSRKTLWLMDCKTRRMGIKAFVSYGAIGGMGKPALSRFHGPTDIRMDDVVPETMGAVLFKLTCEARMGEPQRPSM